MDGKGLRYVSLSHVTFNTRSRLMTMCAATFVARAPVYHCVSYSDDDHMPILHRYSTGTSKCYCGRCRGRLCRPTACDTLIHLAKASSDIPEYQEESKLFHGGKIWILQLLVLLSFVTNRTLPTIMTSALFLASRQRGAGRCYNVLDTRELYVLPIHPLMIG